MQIEGSFGSTQQQEEKLEYSLKALFEPIQTQHTTHTFKMGGGYGHYNAHWKRPVTTSIYSSATGNIANLSCYSNTGHKYDACDEGNGQDGQFLKNRTSYLAGKTEVQQDRWHAFYRIRFNGTNTSQQHLAFVQTMTA